MKQKFKFYGEKLIYSDKRQKGLKSVLVSLLTIVVSMIIALLITSIIYKDPSLFGKIFTKFFTAPFTDAAITNNTVGMIAVFAVAAVAFLIAMKSGLFNIGISGQMMFGAAIATIVAQHLINVPNGLSQIILVLISIVSACMIGTLIGILKAFLNVNEVVSSIMFNWIIYFIATMMVAKLCAQGPDGLYTQDLSHLNDLNTSNLVLQSSDGTSWLPLIILAIVVTCFAIVLLTYTTLGKKIINTGMSSSAAKYAGYSVKFNQILAMSISGAIAGILGVMVYLGNSTVMPIQVAAKSIPQQGFVGISVGLIAMSNPWAILPISCLFGMIDGAKSSLSVNFGVDPAISDTIFGIIVYGAAIISIFYFLVPFKWYLRIFKGKAYADNYQNYINHVNQEIDDATSLLHYLKQQTIHNSNNDNNYFDEKQLEIRLKKFNLRLPRKITKQQYLKYCDRIYLKFDQRRKKQKKVFLQTVRQQERGGK